MCCIFANTLSLLKVQIGLDKHVGLDLRQILINYPRHQILPYMELALMYLVHNFASKEA